MRLSPYQRIFALAAGMAAVFFTTTGLARRYYRQPDPLRAAPTPSLQEDSGPPTEPLTEESLTLLFCGLDDTGLLTDVILLARYDRAASRVDLLQIPRDSYIGPASTTGKINGVYAKARTRGEDGLTALRELLEEQLWLKIDYAAQVDLAAVRAAVDDLGGVKIDLPQPVDYLPGQTLPAGRQTLTGEQAEWFLRYRKGYAMGDLGRLEAQQIFLRAAVDSLRSAGRGKALRLVGAHYGSVRTDLPLGKAMSLASLLYTGQGPQLDLWLLEGEGGQNGPYQVYEIDRQAAADLLNDRFRPADEPVDVGMLKIPALPPPPQPEPQPPAPLPDEISTPPLEGVGEEIEENRPGAAVFDRGPYKEE